MRLKHYLVLCFEEAFRSLRFHRRVVVPALAVMVVSLTLLGGFLLVSENLDTVLATWRERGQLQVFLRDDVTVPDRTAIEAVLRAAPAVDEYRYLSPDDAALLFRDNFAELGEVLDLLADNPLPASYAVTVLSDMRSERVLEVLSADLAKLRAVDGVQYDLQVIRRLELGVRAMRLIGLILGGTVLLAAVVSTANVIRVMVVSRHSEIATMRLVGASEALVMGRFLAEGAVQGVLAGFAALILLYSSYSLGLAYLQRGALGFLSDLPFEFLNPLFTVALVLGGALTGMAGSWLAFGRGGLRPEV